MPLSSYILPLTGSAALMSISWVLGRWNYSLAWIIIFIVMNFIKSKMWKQREKRLLAMRATTMHEKEVIMAQMAADLPAWVQFPDCERVEWMNKVVLQAWPYIGEYAKKYIKENIEPMVKASMPSPFKSFRFEQIDMGDIPCRLHGIKVYTENVGRDRVIMDMDVAYAGDCDFVVSVGAFKGGMNNLQFSGKLRAILAPMLPYPPLVGGVSAYFLDNPKIDFNLTGIGEMVELPGLMAAVRSVITSQVQAIAVVPNAITVPLVPTVDLVQLQFPEPDGVIRIHVVEAKDLENKDISFIKKGRSDPYAVLTLGTQVFKTKVIDDNLNPVWNEFYEAMVAQASGQRLRVELYDEDNAGNDEELGRISLDLATIRKKGYSDEWYALDAAEHGSLHLKIYWMSLTRDARDLEVDQWESEWLKANRTMHSAMLMVYVDNASDMPFPKVGVEPSPIISLEVGNEKKETFPKFKTINPVWQEKFVFFLSHPEQQQLKVEAKDEGTKRSLGSFVVSLSPILAERNLELYQQTFNLSLGTHQTPLVMTVRIRPLRGGVPVATTATSANDVKTANSYSTSTSGKPPVPPHQNIETNNNVLRYTNENLRGAMPEPGDLRPVAGMPDAESVMTDLDTESIETRSVRSPCVRRIENRKLSSISGFGSLSRSKLRKRKRLALGNASINHGSVASLKVGTCGKLEFLMRYLLQTNRLMIHIYRAENLPTIQVQGSADPYVQVKVASRERDHTEKVSTACAEQTLNPVWDETFEFDIHPRALPEYNVIIKVKDGCSYGMFSSPPVIGRLSINLSNLDLVSRPFQELVDLEPPAQ